MSNSKIWLALVIGSLGLTLAPGAFAGKGSTKGGGGNVVIPVTITFRDGLDDRVKSDGSPYVDSLEGVKAFISSSGGAGDLGLILNSSPREVFLDFTDCVSATTCQSPFGSTDSDLVNLARIDVDAGLVKQDGLLGMLPGETISAPMRIRYWLSKGADPGFVEFNSALKGKNPCKMKSAFVTAERTSEKTWEIIFDHNSIACATLPGGTELAGTFLMPLQFTVQIK